MRKFRRASCSTPTQDGIIPFIVFFHFSNHHAPHTTTPGMELSHFLYFLVFPTTTHHTPPHPESDLFHFFIFLFSQPQRTTQHHTRNFPNFPNFPNFRINGARRTTDHTAPRIDLSYGSIRKYLSPRGSWEPPWEASGFLREQFWGLRGAMLRSRGSPGPLLGGPEAILYLRGTILESPETDF